MKGNLGLILVLALIAGAFLLLRTPRSAISADQLNEMLASGRPVLVELFSNT